MLALTTPQGGGYTRRILLAARYRGGFTPSFRCALVFVYFYEVEVFVYFYEVEVFVYFYEMRVIIYDVKNTLTIK